MQQQGQPDRPNDSAKRSGESGQSDQVKNSREAREVRHEAKRAKQRIFAVTLSAMLFALCFSAHAAQQSAKVPRVGYLSYGSVEIDKSLLAALQQGLRELG